MTRWFLVAITVAALGVYLAASYAERYHTKAFQEHVRILRTTDDPKVIQQEVERFHRETRLDKAATVMQWGYPVATALWVLTAVLLLGDWL